MRILSILFLVFLAVSFVNRVSALSGFTNQAVASEHEGESVAEPAEEPEATPPAEGTTEGGTETAPQGDTAPTPGGEEEPPQ